MRDEPTRAEAAVYEVVAAADEPTADEAGVDARAVTPSQAARLRAVREWPIRHKASMVVVVCVLSGMVLGELSAQGRWSFWALLTLVVFSLAVLLAGARWWIAEPLERMVERLEVVSREPGGEAVKALGTQATDEVGRSARAAAALGRRSIRFEHEAKRLRRTLESLVAKETKRATQQLERLAMRDPLTGLGNRRALESRLPDLWKACDQTGEDLVCVMIDVDLFKQVNDELGHAAGDEVLSLLAEMISASIRPQDLAVRLGGDEFAVFLPNAQATRAAKMVGQLRKLLRQQAAAQYPEGPWPNLSAGIATVLRDGCETGEALLAAADEQLYEAKRGGRGRTCGNEAENA